MNDSGTLDVSVVVPVRNAGLLVERCLKSARRNAPAEIIVVDGDSRDDTVALAQPYADAVLSDGGGGVALARNLGAEAARCPYVAFVDVDVELPDNALAGLLEELIRTKADAMQAEIHSVDSGDYWSRALTNHHSGGRSKSWFGVVCTVFPRDRFLQFRLDPSFRSGEDIELRHRMVNAGARLALSERVAVRHQFEPGFAFARGQWLADGTGLGRMLRKYRLREVPLLFLPAAGAVLGILRSWRNPPMIPYYVLYLAFNYVGIVQGFFDRDEPVDQRSVS